MGFSILGLVLAGHTGAASWDAVDLKSLALPAELMADPDRPAYDVVCCCSRSVPIHRPSGQHEAWHPFIISLKRAQAAVVYLEKVVVLLQRKKKYQTTDSIYDEQVRSGSLAKCDKPTSLQ